MTEEEIKKIEDLTKAVRALDNTLSGIAWLKLAEMTEGSFEKVKKIRNDLQVCGNLWTDITRSFEKNVK